VEKVGFGLDPTLGTLLGVAIGIAVASWFLLRLSKMVPEKDEPAVSSQPNEAERTGDSLAC
jgi:hypothetical protein